MPEVKTRVLIGGAGVIGSIYTVKFIEVGIDVTIFTRSDRLKALQENGLQYNEKVAVKSIKVNVIGTLGNEDIYGFIFVPVRYDQSESALLALKSNKSRNIVTMANNSAGFSAWPDIVGDRLLPTFPGAGGQIKDGILYARFSPVPSHCSCRAAYMQGCASVIQLFSALLISRQHNIRSVVVAEYIIAGY